MKPPSLTFFLASSNIEAQHTVSATLTNPSKIASTFLLQTSDFPPCPTAAVCLAYLYTQVAACPSFHPRGLRQSSCHGHSTGSPTNALQIPQSVRSKERPPRIQSTQRCRRDIALPSHTSEGTWTVSAGLAWFLPPLISPNLSRVSHTVVRCFTTWMTLTEIQTSRNGAVSILSKACEQFAKRMKTC